MSGVGETSSEPVEGKEDKEFGTEAEDHLGDDCMADPTRYMYYR